MRPWAGNQSPERPPSPMRQWLTIEWVQVFLITLFAAALRLVLLDCWPPGLYHDEAYNGLDALRVVQGVRPIFFEANNGREPLFIYLAAVAIRILGQNALALRIPAAILGILTIPATYLMAREWFGASVAKLTAVVAAGTFWHLNLSRVGFRAVGLPLFLALWLWQWSVALRRKRMGHWALAGAFLGLGMYTYVAARFIPLVVVVWLVSTSLQRKAVPWTGLFAMGGTAILISLPLLMYGAQHLETVVARSAQVSVFAPEINGGHVWEALVSNIIATIGMFNGRGDFIPRHNLPYRPVFDTLMGIAFLVGLARCVRAFRRRDECAVPVLAVAVMLMPTTLAEGAPHMLRGAGAMPAVFVFPALGLDLLRSWLQPRLSALRTSLVIGLVLCLSTASTAYDYFLKHVRSEATYYNFESGVTELAAEINAFVGFPSAPPTTQTTEPDAGLVLLDERLWRDWASLRFLAKRSERLILLDESTPRSPYDAVSTKLIVWPYADVDRYVGCLPEERLITAREGPMERGDLEPEARLLCLIFEAGPTTQAMDNLRVRMENGITLWGAGVQRVERAVKARLFWRASEFLPADYTVFVHLMEGEKRLAQSDSYPVSGYYPTSLWRPGDVVADEHILQVSLPAGRSAALHVGMYSLKSMERLHILDETGAVVGDHLEIPVP